MIETLSSAKIIGASIERFKETGATHLAFMNRGLEVNKVYEIFKQKIIPYFKEMDMDGRV